MKYALRTEYLEKFRVKQLCDLKILDLLINSASRINIFLTHLNRTPTSYAKEQIKNNFIWLFFIYSIRPRGGSCNPTVRQPLGFVAHIIIKNVPSN